MNTTPSPNSQSQWDQSPQQAPPAWQENRPEWQAPRRRYASAGGWVWGLALIAVGVVFLLQQLGWLTLNNWWALFILIPAVGAFSSVAEQMRRNGRFDAGSIGSLVFGLVMTFLAAIFLFNMNWGTSWPWFLVIIGVGALIGALMRR